MTRKMVVEIERYGGRPAATSEAAWQKIDAERRAKTAGMLSSLNMLIMTDGGSFSAADCVGWLQEVGFHETRVESLTYEQSMIVGFK